MQIIPQPAVVEPPQHHQQMPLREDGYVDDGRPDGGTLHDPAQILHVPADAGDGVFRERKNGQSGVDLSKCGLHPAMVLFSKDIVVVIAEQDDFARQPALRVGLEPLAPIFMAGTSDEHRPVRQAPGRQRPSHSSSSVTGSGEKKPRKGMQVRRPCADINT